MDAARSKLTLDEQKLFDNGLASCRAANFPWWQDDHNYYIDLRISLPMRWACQGIADRIGADHPGRHTVPVLGRDHGGIGRRPAL